MQLSEQNRSCKILIRGREICTTIDDFAKVREDTETDIGPLTDLEKDLVEESR